MMKRMTLILAMLAGAPGPGRSDPPPPQIWLDEPAVTWESDALPLGNGRLGCMVFGGVSEERIQFNVDSLWTGDENPAGGYDDLHMGAFQNFGDLTIHLDGVAAEAAPVDYRRSLDLSQGVHRITYGLNGVQYQRETFCSRPDQVIVVRFTASRPGQYSGRIRVRDAHPGELRVTGSDIGVSGALNNGMAYAARIRAVADSGSVVPEGGELRFRDCDSLTLFLAAETDYVMDPGQGWSGKAPAPRVTAAVDRAIARGYPELLEEHRADHQALFGRVTLNLGDTPEAQSALPMDQRLKAYAQGAADPELEVTLFQYGRYLLIGSSRPGSLPANLQGLWNDRNDPAWHSDYHSNINLQMNYWLAEPANLSECHEPLLDFLMAMRAPYRTATRAQFGDLPGFTCRTSQNITGGMGWKWNLPASAWYARHFWEHYEFDPDLAYLRSVAYPWMKEVSLFWEAHLKALPDGTLVAPDGWSPEHGPVEDGVSHDQQIVWDLFTMTLRAAEILGGEESFRKRLSGLRDRLAGPRVGRWGQLQEWMTDRDDPTTRHRHTSHLYAVYPGQQISRVRTPELAEAARVSLEARGETGDSRRSWTWPWRCALWARFGQAEKCHDMIRGLLTHNILSNLFTSHPPMQLDGNFGMTAGMCEMLIQSHAGEIHLLPAIPGAWSSGEVRGLRARGGFQVSMQWRAGALQQAVVLARVDGPCRLRCGTEVRIVAEGGPVPVTQVEPGVVEFYAESGTSYEVVPVDRIPDES